MFFSEYPTYNEFKEAKWGTAVFKFPIMIGITLILIPICLLKDISKMRFASLLSIFSLIYAILVIVIETPYYFTSLNATERSLINWTDISQGFNSHLYFFQGTATIFFAYTCHAGAFPVYKTLKNSVTRRINKVFMRSVLLDAVIYVLVGVCGFLTQPLDTPDLIIYRQKKYTNDLAMVIARFGIAINLILSTPANYNAFRLSFFEILWGTNKIDNKR